MDAHLETVLGWEQVLLGLFHRGGRCHRGEGFVRAQQSTSRTPLPLPPEGAKLFIRLHQSWVFHRRARLDGAVVFDFRVELGSN